MAHPLLCPLSRLWLCLLYQHLSTAPHKLSPRSTRCLDILTHCIIISCHVVFDEEDFPLADSSPPPSRFPRCRLCRCFCDAGPLQAGPPRGPGPPPPPPVPCATPLTPPAPRAASPTSSESCAAPTLLTPLAPCAAPSTSVALPPLPAPCTAPSPVSHPTRFTDPARVYHRRK
jgi:hypothetical protein